MNKIMHQLGVIGNPVSHSLSPIIHTHLANWHGVDVNYRRIETTKEKLLVTVKQFFSKGGMGLSVTSPFKQHILNCVDELSDEVCHTQAANMLARESSGYISAHSTDGEGLLFALEDWLEMKDKRILLIGSGGAVRSVIRSLLSKQAIVTVAGRNVIALALIQQQFDDVTCCSLEQLVGAYDLIINATPTSLYGRLPKVPSTIFKDTACLDMVYQSKPTCFMRYALAHGATEAQDGLAMLVGQAMRAFEYWFDLSIELQQRREMGSSLLEILKNQ